MARFYFVTGVGICALFIYASMIGWKIIDPGGPTGSKPGGGVHYHK